MSVAVGRPVKGSVVYLKSGSPPLTVVTFTEDGGVVCQWELDDGSFSKDIFVPATLTPDSPAS